MVTGKLLRTVTLALTCCAAFSSIAQSEVKTVKMIPQFDLRIIDPYFTTAYTTRNHAYMVYDTLFAIDADNKIQPQMVDRWEHDEDQKVWTFVLRKGLAFHDGQAVRAADVIASLARWGKMDAFGQQMYAAIDKAEVLNDETFRLVFTRPFPMVLDGLAKPSGVAPFILPERVAQTPPNKQIEDATGSGPYIFIKDEFRAGDRAVYEKNKNYVSRQEPPSGLAGGKPVYVDRFEWVVVKDPQSQANALLKGEVDMLEWVPAEQYSRLKADPNIEIFEAIPGSAFFMHMNHLLPPFNNPKISKAAILAISQAALMQAQIGNKDLYRTCPSIYPCDSTFAKQSSSGLFTGKPNFELARSLLKEAGYDGTPIVLMYPPEFTVLNKFGPVLSKLLTEAGFKVDLQAIDWPSTLMRRAKKDPVSQGGWNMFVTGWGGADRLNPIFIPPLTGNGENGWFGWLTDNKLEELKAEFLLARGAEEQLKSAEKIQLHVFENGVLGPLGEVRALLAFNKKKISGVLPGQANVFWNIKKE